MTNPISERKNKQVLCIMGPTASGKTALAIETAKALNGEVVSVDSALIYKDMNIGTAKPNEHEQDGIHHHLLDILTPEQSYSVADFIRDANKAILSILDKGKLPILAGGTMMYFNALVNGINELPPADKKAREQISLMTNQEIHHKLEQVDPISAKRINVGDTQRLTRALEVYLSSGKNLTHWQNKEKSLLGFDYLQFSIMPKERSTLHELIEKRFDIMLAQGFVDEVSMLLNKYSLDPDMPSMRSVGYRQIWQFLRGELSNKDMRERGIIATRQLAKRQVTWLRNWQDITTLISYDDENLKRVIQKVGATSNTIM